MQEAVRVACPGERCRIGVADGGTTLGVRIVQLLLTGLPPALPLGAVTGWYPWVITRETLALQPYERSTPTRRMHRQNGFEGSHGHYYSVLKGHLSAPVR